MNSYCSLPVPTLPNAYVNAIGQQVGDTTTFTCSDGYEYAFAPSVTCNSNSAAAGVWSSVSGTCTCTQFLLVKKIIWSLQQSYY